MDNELCQAAWQQLGWTEAGIAIEWVVTVRSILVSFI
jgi:hypothetical protein